MSIAACAPTDTMRIDARTTAQPTQNWSRSDVSESSVEIAKLERLWRERQIADVGNQGYPLGPGDVLTVSVPDVDEISRCRVRVSARGTIELPMLGMVNVQGLSEDALATEIDRKLQKYMYRPQATVFVDEYHNRTVAVIGAVNRPGLVLLTSPVESLLDVITRAGGLTGAAAAELILIPSRPGTIGGSSVIPRPYASDLAGEVASQVPATGDLTQSVSSEGRSAPIATVNTRTAGASPALTDAEFIPAVARESRPAGKSLNSKYLNAAADQNETPAPAGAQWLAGDDDAFTLKLKNASLDGAGKYVNMPMRPGDVVLVPGGGDVMVVGWVHQPGRFQVGSGLTVLGAIGAAGGPMYAAKTNNIALIRTAKDGAKITIPINMDEVTQGKAADLPVQANDVIDVPYSGMRIGPYIFYSILTRMGIGGPIIPY